MKAAGIIVVLSGMVFGLSGMVLRLPNRYLGQAGQPALLKMIALGPPSGVALDARTQRVFVSCGLCRHNNQGTVSILDARSGAIVRTVMVGPFPSTPVVDERTGRVFVADYRAVAMLDAGTGRVVRTIRLRGGIGSIMAAPTAGHVFIGSATSATHDTLITMLDARSGAILHQTRLSGSWIVSAVAEHAGRVVVTSFDATHMPNHTTGTLRLLDVHTDAVVRTVQIGPEFYIVAVDEQDGHIFIAEGDAITGSRVEMRDARSGTLLRTTPIHSNPAAATVDTATQRVFVATLYATDILAARSGTLVHSTDVSPTSTPVTLARTGGILVLLPSPTDEQSNLTGPGYLVVLDGHTGIVRQRIPIGPITDVWAGTYDALVIDARSGHGLVLNGNGVTMFDATRL